MVAAALCVGQRQTRKVPAAVAQSAISHSQRAEIPQGLSEHHTSSCQRTVVPAFLVEGGLSTNFDEGKQWRRRRTVEDIQVADAFPREQRVGVHQIIALLSASIPNCGEVGTTSVLPC